jgi:hypothetical protein
MEDFVSLQCGSNARGGNRSIDNSAAYKAMVKYELKRSECEIPVVVGPLARRELYTITEAETYVSPLYISTYYNFKSVSGPEAIIKWFNREQVGRIVKVVTNKGEIFYGNNGIILDKDFTPLLLATAKVHWDESADSAIVDKYIVYVHPKVFIDDSVAMNKSLARKAVPFYLSHSIYDCWTVSVPVEVKIEDCSNFVVKAKDCKETIPDSDSFTKVLQDNIDEVILQLTDDDNR